MKKIFPVILILSFICLIPAPAFAADREWSGATNGAWATGTNWVLNTAPGATLPTVNNTDLATFNNNTNTTVTVDTWRNIKSITFGASANAFTLTDGTLYLTSGGTISNNNDNAFTETVNSAVVLEGDYNFYDSATTTSSKLSFGGGITSGVAGGTQTLTLRGANAGNSIISSVIGDGTGTVALTKTDAGTWILSVANTYTGATAVNAGVLNIRNNTATGTAAGGVTVASGAAIQTQGGITVGDEALSLNGTGVGDTGALRNISGDNSWAGVITLAGATRINSDADTLTLGEGGITGAQNLTVGGAGNTNISGVIVATTTLTKDGAGTLILGGANTYIGNTNISAGTLSVTNAAALGPGATTAVTCGATLEINNVAVTNEAIYLSVGAAGTPAFLTGTGTASLGGDITLCAFGGNSTLGGTGTMTLSGVIGGNGQGITKTGTGTITLSGANTYTGATTVNAGKLSITSATGLGTTAGGVSVADGATLDLNGTFDVGTEAVTLNGGSTLSSTSGTNSISGTITVAGNSIADVSTSLTLSGSVLGSTGAGFQILDKNGAGTLTLSGTSDNTSLATTVDAGTLILAKTPADVGFNATARVTVNGGTLQLNGTENRQIWDAAIVTLNGGTFDQNGKNETIGTLVLKGGAISGLGTLTNSSDIDAQSGSSATILGGAVGLTKTTAGTVTLSGANTYSGATAINTGTVVASNASALGNGSAVTVAAGGTLDVGTTNVTVNNTYTQNGTLKVTVASPSSSGKITSNANAAVAAGSSVSVTVPGGIYIPNNATFTVVDGAGGAGVNIPGTITSSDPRLKFSALSSSGDLILMVSRLGTGFSSIATDPNGAAVGAVLDNISDPSADMTDVLNTLEGLDDQQVSSALDTFITVADRGVIESSNVSLSQFIGVTTDRLMRLFARAHGSAGSETGVSAGCEGLQGFEAWGQGFGEYLHQDPRGTSNGYRATVWGTAIGGDIPAFNNRVRMGLSGGYAQSGINSKDNSGKTDIDSYQGTLYAGYADIENPYYLNGAFSFAYNKYDSLRHIAAGTIMRTANSDYDGQQYSVLLDGGYTFKSGEFGITPMASLQYTRLHLEGYTEKNAGALNLHVNSQNYDMLQSGLGMKIERPFKTETGTIIPEVHARWLYDFIGDRQETTSTFSGGGGSFATNGFDPAQHSLNVGTKLTLVTKGNWSLETNYDFEYKEDFTSHTGWANARYKF
jgi:outer membrane autotransporter protein